MMDTSMKVMALISAAVVIALVVATTRWFKRR